MYRAPPMQLELPYRAEQGFDGLYGLEISEFTEDVVRGHVAVRDDLKQPAGLVHGGVYAALAEALASLGTGVPAFAAGRLAVGLSNHSSFMRPITAGTIHAEARRRHAGRTTAVWEVEITDDDGRLCVLTRVTMAIREADARQR